MKEDTIQHLASEMDELQVQHRDVLAKVRFFQEFSCFFLLIFLVILGNTLSEGQSSNQSVCFLFFKSDVQEGRNDRPPES